ncbi:hypothetical protein KKB10_00430 [Patescibacteria group bacterium]|nr:hypothetical protein [Patescibacteria group bacterium]MBU1075171.1 hypothetical protein [Patescibacteria group bacterium]MBU1951965.1 hypothetical protein [Patescibacteria group bacterium]
MYDKKPMFPATCDECGNKCEVPFRPSGGKPVLCSNCFGEKGNSHSGGSGGRNFSRSNDRGYGRSNDRGFGRSSDRGMYTAICDKCGGKAEVPFKPTSGKPIFCSDCFSKEDRPGGFRDGGRPKKAPSDGVGNKQISEQLTSLNNKLDRVIGFIEKAVVGKEMSKMEIDPRSSRGQAKKTVEKKETTKKPATKKVAKKAVKKAVKKKK